MNIKGLSHCLGTQSALSEVGINPLYRYCDFSTTANYLGRQATPAGLFCVLHGVKLRLHLI